jgi:hypothetical protein
MLNNKTKNLLLFLMVLCTGTACVHVKEYQKSRVKDSEMTLANRKAEKNEMNFQSYREVVINYSYQNYF